MPSKLQGMTKAERKRYAVAKREERKRRREWARTHPKPIPTGWAALPVKEKKSILRSKRTRYEDMLDKALTIEGINHRSQLCIGPFFPDFVLEKWLIVEVDGSVHNSVAAKAYDADRTAYFKTRGYSVIRFRNDQIENDMDGVIQTIRETLRPPSKARRSPQ